MSCSTINTGMFAATFLDQVRHALALGGGEASQRLIEQTALVVWSRGAIPKSTRRCPP